MIRLSLEAILEIHNIQLELFGGGEGIRDIGLLESALARPRSKAVYQSPSLLQLAAAYLYGIAKNHPFVDGNKRTAFLAADTFLRVNGYEIKARQAQIVAVVLDVAAGEIDEGTVAGWIERRLVKTKRE